MKKLCAIFLLSIMTASPAAHFAAADDAPVKAPPKKTKAALPISDPRGEPELVLCSQNLETLGSFEESRALAHTEMTLDTYNEQRAALVERFRKTKCDVIAVQELVGKNKEDAANNLRSLGAQLRTKTNRFFDVAVGDTNDPHTRVGFLVARDRADIVNQVSYDKVELPKLTPHERPRFFIRAPFEVQLFVKGRGDASAKTVTLVNFHFKSHADSRRDPSALEWETYRMQMAEAVRRVMEAREKSSFASGETLLAALGDRNSNYDTASARILEGTVLLKDFQGDNPVCRLSKRGVPICKRDTFLPQRLFSVLTADPEVRTQQGTFLYQGTFSWLDDILLPQESLRTAWEKFNREDKYDSGVVREPKNASDHAMVYVRLNW